MNDFTIMIFTECIYEVYEIHLHEYDKYKVGKVSW